MKFAMSLKAKKLGLAGPALNAGGHWGLGLGQSREVQTTRSLSLFFLFAVSKC